MDAAIGRWLKWALIGWLAVLLVAIAGFWWFVELIALGIVAWSFLAIFVVAPLCVVGACIWAGVRGQRWAWAAAALVVLTHVALVAGGAQVATGAAYLRFLTQKGAYDRIVADYRSGKLPMRRDEHGCFGGRLYGVSYSSNFCGAGDLFFVWRTTPHGGAVGIVYDELDCPPLPPPPPEPPSPPGELPPQMKHGGRMDDRMHLQGHYCLSILRGM